MRSLDLIKPYFRENRTVIAIGMISLIIVDVLQLFIPRIIKWAVDDLTTRYLGLELRNPLVLAASPLTGDLERLVQFEAAGAAAALNGRRTGGGAGNRTRVPRRSACASTCVSVRLASSFRGP